jgi:hypothetical protein
LAPFTVSEQALVILLKNLLAHFDGLEAQFRDLLDPKLAQELARLAQRLSPTRRRSRRRKPIAELPSP